jgi:hypothetical protein
MKSTRSLLTMRRERKLSESLLSISGTVISRDLDPISEEKEGRVSFDTERLDEFSIGSPIIFSQLTLLTCEGNQWNGKPTSICNSSNLSAARK